MAGYSTSNPPFKIAGGLTGSMPAIWMYSSVDAGSTVDGAGYFTNAKELGMKAGDLVFVLDNDSTYFQWTAHSVVSLSGSAANLSDGVSIGGAANSD